jgi:hypothetical protein
MLTVKLNRSPKGSARRAKREFSRAVLILLRVVCATALSSVAGAQEKIKLSIYELPEQEACGPAGYQEKGDCPIVWNEDIFKSLQSELTLVQPGITIPPSYIQLTKQALGIVLPYTPVASRASLQNRESALFVFEWPDNAPRDLTITRPASKYVQGRVPFQMPVLPYRTRYYHEPLDHIDPAKKVIWYITSGLNRYTIMFER